MNKWGIYKIDGCFDWLIPVPRSGLNTRPEYHLKTGQMEHNWMLRLERSGHRRLRSRSYNCAVWHAYPGNFREGRTRHAVINQCLNPRQVNGEREKNESEKTAGGNKRDGYRYWGKRSRGIQWECDTFSLSKPHLSPARPLFFPSLCSLAEIHLFWDYFSSVNSSLITWWMMKWFHWGSAATPKSFLIPHIYNSRNYLM